jgi:CMP-2-keto-3-deoxyoctulosonic acid synthetase
MPGKIQGRPGHLKCHKSEIIICVENDEPYNKQQHVHNLLLAMTHYNCLLSRPGHLKRHKSEVIVYVENDEPYNKQQHVHNLLLAMMHCNYLETKMHQP